MFSPLFSSFSVLETLRVLQNEGLKWGALTPGSGPVHEGDAATPFPRLFLFFATPPTPRGSWHPPPVLTYARRLPSAARARRTACGPATRRWACRCGGLMSRVDRLRSLYDEGGEAGRRGNRTAILAVR